MSKGQGEDHRTRKVIRQYVRRHVLNAVVAEEENVILNGVGAIPLPTSPVNPKLLVLMLDHPSSWWKRIPRPNEPDPTQQK